MTDFLGGYISSVAGAAIICAAAILLTPEGRVKGVLKLVCGMLLIAAMISPVIDAPAPDISMSMARYGQKAQEISRAASQETDYLNRTLIAQGLEAYILDKARQIQGLELKSVAVKLDWSTQGYWYPVQVELEGSGPASEKSRLETAITTQLGIPARQQHWSEDES